jgi:transcription elongation regulator 1
LSCRSSFNEFASRHGKDERFKAVEKMREREQMFADFLGELKKAGNKVKEEQKLTASKSKPDKVGGLVGTLQLSYRWSSGEARFPSLAERAGGGGDIRGHRVEEG